MSLTPEHVMTPHHPRWDEFCDRLGGPDGCNFQGEGAELHWTCGGGRDKSAAIRILLAMGLSEEDVLWSIKYFDQQGGFCDCEILFNVDPARTDA